MELIAAVICGFLSGLGIGGGSLLMVWLTAFAGFPQQTARCINLLYFLPAAAVSVLFHSKNRYVEWKKTVWAVLGGVLFAAAGVFLSAYLPTDLLRKLFGGMLILIGITELVHKK